MSETPQLRLDASGEAAVLAHLQRCDADFMPPLSSRLDLPAYAAKLCRLARRVELWEGEVLVGLVALYANALPPDDAFISSVSLEPSWRGQGWADRLLDTACQLAQAAGLGGVSLELHCDNLPARRLYERHQFIPGALLDHTLQMRRPFRDPAMDNKRDYNAEIVDSTGRKYAYGFDFDVMHPYMIQSFRPFFRTGSMLELGSFKGDFTRRLLDHFDDVSCVEASDQAMAEAQARLNDRVHFHNALFEQVQLPRRYDNIVMTHVLEHLDDPVKVLRRVNEEWLAPGGRFFLACPNANAPSRQIAVKMGLISHNSAVTPAEAEHGHRCTYALDTLERDAVAAGLKVVHRSGIFFKALANFQWDRLLQTDIISPAYLDGCFALGQQYPDLCSTIYLVCESGG